MIPDQPHILVTGAPRTGTTFLGRMLSLPPGVAYLDEPLNFETGLEGIEQSFLYCDTSNPETLQPVDSLMRDLLIGRAKFKPSRLAPNADRSALKRLGRRLFNSRTQLLYRLNASNPLVQRYVIKDPMASFAAEYLHQRFGLQTIIIVRHPAATLASYKRLGWTFNLGDLTNQPTLKRRYLDGILPSAKKLEQLTQLQQHAYLWVATYTVLEDYTANNPGMIFVRHEDLSKDAVAQFRTLYTKTGLPFTPSVEHQITSHTRSGNPIAPPNNAVHALKRDSARNIDRWKALLTPQEVSEIRGITEPLSSHYYDDASWQQ